MILPSSLVFLHRVAWLILECARRMSTFISCAFREQEDDQAAHPILPRLLVISSGMGAGLSGLSCLSRLSGWSGLSGFSGFPISQPNERDERDVGDGLSGLSGWSDRKFIQKNLKDQPTRQTSPCASIEDHQAPSPPRSASKKGTWPRLPHPSSR